MEKEYKIKGIDKIIKKVGKETLAKSFKVEEEADFEELITKDLESIGIPNGLEIAGYEELNYRDLRRGMNEYFKELSEKYTKDGKAVMGISYQITNFNISDLYFYIDEPIKSDILKAQTFMGVVKTLGHTMGKGFYEEHKKEISELEEKRVKYWENINDFDRYTHDYFDKLSGIKEDKEETYCFDFQREHAQDEKIRMAGVEKLIAKFTGGKPIKDTTLHELEQIRQGLISREEKVKEAFAEKFGTKDKEKE